MSRPIDRDTVDRLVVAHLPDLLRLARRLSGDSHTAEEMVQEALCRVLERWRSFRGEASFRTWMMQIVVNVDRDRRRRRRDMKDLPIDTVDAGTSEPNEMASLSEMSKMIRAAIDALPERQREVAMLCLGEGLAAADVAAILEISEANVHTCLHLARKRIAQAIGVNLAGEK